MTAHGRRELLAALSGVLLALSFPKFGHFAVAWVALAPLLAALGLPGRSGTPGGAGTGFRLGYVAGAVSALGVVYWTSLVVVQFGGLSMPVGIGVMVLLCLALALFPALFGAFVGAWVKTFGPAALLVAPVAWVATEILRAHTLFNFSWCLLGYSQQENLPFIQVARYGAVYAVSFLVCGASAALAYAVHAAPSERRRALVALGAVLAVVGVHGTWLLGQPVPEAGRLRVGLVQGAVLQDEKWDPLRADRNVQRHLDLTEEAARRGAELVVWPESALPGYFDRDVDRAEELRDLVRRHGLYLIFGNDDREESSAGYRIWVGAKMLTPRGELPYRYRKMRLVPFGEYVPLQPLLTLGGRTSAKLVNQVADFTPGTEFSLADLARTKAATFICYEAIFPDHVREFVARGAGLLVNITNDGWYGRTSAPYQHLAMAAFRAVENERWLVRAANTGFTAVVDPRGRVLEKTALFERTVVVREVPVTTRLTPYARFGDVFAWACLGGAVALTASALAGRAR